MRLLALAVLLCLAPGALAPVAWAQPAEAPDVPAAEASFQRGLASYQAGSFEEAASWFLQAATSYGYNSRTTAAYLMAGKAHYAAADFDAVAGVVTTLLNRYPRSRYAADARALLEATVDRERARPARPFALGIALPVDEDNLNFSQALFNGVRLAVDEYNAANPARSVRMIFRDSQGSEDGARLAVGLLANQDVDAIVGPLYSFEVLEAAAAAEQQRIPLLAPMATDDAVTEGRQYVFQFNPTPASWARAMARFAVDGLGARQLGVVAEQEGLGGRVAPVFDDAVVRLGAEVPVYDLLADRRDWFALTQRIPAADLDTLDALYVPLGGGQAQQTMRNVLRSLDQGGVRLRVLGNAAWHQAEDAEAASAYGVTYTLDFNPDPARARTFVERYRALSGGVDPDRLAYTGYDTTRFLLAHLADARGEGADALAAALRAAEPYQGLGIRVDLAGGNSNRGLYLMEYRDGRRVLVE